MKRKHRLISRVVVDDQGHVSVFDEQGKVVPQGPRPKRDSFANWMAQWNTPSIELISKTLPGRVLAKTEEGYWLWLRNSSLVYPDALEEASEIYLEAGGFLPGPRQWYEDILLAKRPGPLTSSYRSTLYCPIDLFGNLDEQVREIRAFCRAAREELIQVSKKRPAKRGKKREELLAENILMLVLRHWGNEDIASIATRFYGSSAEHRRQLTTRRIFDTKCLLKSHVKDFPARLQRPRK